jgi:hypothetical protein
MLIISFMRCILVFIFSLVQLGQTFAQDSLHVARFDYNGNEFLPAINRIVTAQHNDLSAYFVYRLLDTLATLTEPACIVGVAIVKFRLSKKFGVIDVACTNTTPAMLAEQFKMVLLKSSKYWLIPQESNLIYVLPIHYSNPFDCKEGKVKSDVFGTENVFVFDDGTQLADKVCRVLKGVNYKIGQPFRLMTPDPSKK